MRTRLTKKIMTIAFTLMIPVGLTACSSNKDLGDSQGVIISSPDDGTIVNQGPYTSGDGSEYGSDYGTASVGGVESSAVPGSQSDLVAQAGDIVYFNTDSHTLTAQARSILDGQARWLASFSNLNVTVEGHADERGTREYNLALGDRRATSVRNYLISMGVDPRRIQTISFGKEQPMVVGNNGEYWAQNRRVRTRVN